MLPCLRNKLSRVAQVLFSLISEESTKDRHCCCRELHGCIPDTLLIKQTFVCVSNRSRTISGKSVRCARTTDFHMFPQIRDDMIIMIGKRRRRGNGWKNPMVMLTLLSSYATETAVSSELRVMVAMTLWPHSQCHVAKGLLCEMK